MYFYFVIFVSFARTNIYYTFNKCLLNGQIKTKKTFKNKDI